MTFAPSTFTVEINSKPTIAFQAKWQAEAEETCRQWADLHWDEISSKDPNSRLGLPPIIRIRLARVSETEAYDAGSVDGEFCDEVMIVRLSEITAEHQDEASENVLTEDQADNAAEEQSEIQR